MSSAQEFILLLQNWASELNNKDIPLLLWAKNTVPNQITSPRSSPLVLSS